MQTKFEWCGRIKAVEKEHTVIQFALQHIIAEVTPGRIVLPKELRFRELQLALDMLEGTYTIRLFAEFETCLKSWWRSAHQTEPPSRAVDLINGTAARRKIPIQQQDDVHLARKHRNSLVHERDEVVEPVSISQARGYLCRFANFLPERWGP